MGKKKDPLFPFIRENIERIRENIERICIKVGRNPDDVKILAATKERPASMILEAIDAGIKLIGENRVQEAKEKFLLIGDDDVEWHLIGVLQSNKAKDAVKIFSTIHSIYKKKTAEVVSKYAILEDKIMRVLIEVNTSMEDTKAGIKTEDELFRLVEEIKGLPNIEIVGLMTIGPNTDDKLRIRNSFKTLREYFEKLKKAYPELPIKELSMGMSGDYDIAIEEGATIVRLGTIIFGPRGK